MELYQFCCPNFTDKINDAGRKGIAIIPVKIPYEPDKLAFFLQFRSADPDDKNQKLVVADVAIHYCPWCGSKLSDVAELHKTELTKIAEKNKNLISILP